MRCNGSSRSFRIQCFVCSIAYCELLQCCFWIVVDGSLCVLNPLIRPEQAMADCIWMETALIESSLAEHRDMACSWVREQGAIERDLSNKTTYQELVEELRLRPLEARRLAAFLRCLRPEVAEVKQQRVESKPASAMLYPITVSPAMSTAAPCAPDGSATEQPIMQVKSESDTERSHIEVSDQKSTVLPNCSVEKISRSANKPYFFNLKNGTSQYTRPTESAYSKLIASPRDSPLQAQQTAVPNALGGSATEQPIVQENIKSNTKLRVCNQEPTLLPDGWVERISPFTSKPYFFNLHNGTSQNTRPVQSAYPELTQSPHDLPPTLTSEPFLMKRVKKTLNKTPRLQAGLRAASLKVQPVSGGCFWPERLAQALGHLECAQGIFAEIFGDANVRLAAWESKREEHSKATLSKWNWNYKQEETVRRRCQQPGHIARDCTTDVQELARSDWPAASGEDTSSGEDAGRQALPAKRQRGATKKSDYSSCTLSVTA